ncbi:MAG: bifunctional tetrahydrofolate synthase/dihydrofolate synthase [Gammaproteobacteria bacterium]|nr:bifunctional tetrahydrofolate synthase/dihydrofolate synthase [Gammaproteobacteria bacterium]
MRFTALQSWLSWQERLHNTEIELGLERVWQVAQQLGIQAQWPLPVITVAGTNGKGSSVAMLEAIYQHAGYRVGSYTSPHLLNYNERIKINRQPVTDELICEAFEKIDQARQSAADQAISLSYFEFGTMAALSILKDAELDLLILEVGLGGRLDAVNIIDASVALITPIALDHQSWLGDDRESIAAEKAGVIKPGCRVVYNDPEPAAAVLQKVAVLHADFYCLHKNFRPQTSSAATGWDYFSDSAVLHDLPLPSLPGLHQLDNAAAVIQVTQILSAQLPLTESAITTALTDIRLAGRFQTVSHQPAIIVDVAHNEQAVSMLASSLAQHPCNGRTFAVLAMLEDKTLTQALHQIDAQIDRYYLAGLEGSRSLSADDLKQRIQNSVSSDKLCCNTTVTEALQQARSAASSDDRIIIFGSFLTVSAAMQYLQVSASEE